MAIVSGHTKHKLRRLHYVRATAAEAEHVMRNTVKIDGDPVRVAGLVGNRICHI